MHEKSWRAVWAYSRKRAVRDGKTAKTTSPKAPLTEAAHEILNALDLTLQ